LIAWTLLLGIPTWGQTRLSGRDQGFVPYIEESIHYLADRVRDPIAPLQERLDRGEVALAYEPAHGYLKSVLQALEIPRSSQALVFSKSSFQFRKIAPQTPRALYFNDNAYVGWVKEHVMRIRLSIALVIALSSFCQAGSLDGRWDATVTINGTEIPFRIDFWGQGHQFQGALFDGDLKVTSTNARLENEAPVVDFGHYLTRLTASPQGDDLVGKVEGRFERDKYIAAYPFHARRHQAATSSTGSVPSIDVLWEVPFQSPKGEKAWRLFVRQQGPEVQASILRVDGDTGALSGTFKDGKWRLSHFSGSRPLVVELKPASDGTLELKPEGAYTARAKLTAYRPAQARAKGLPEPADFDAHTRIKNSDDVFQFSFPDLDGKILSNNHPRFKGKVVVAMVTGTCCPNCHDEAQFLVQLYRKYRKSGLEIVALDFEESEQQEDGFSRARSFIKKYGVEYTYLIAGAPVEMWEKVPQAVNLNSWPTTFFIGRDGRVKKTHASFASPASGSFHRDATAEFMQTVEELLAENATAAR
jgi:peroxiredoxin